ncbi:hypothetical protein [Microbispora sp. NPDC049633]|uniref:hypothetical protein n=1 Tax=Microbispora sp. NPDC049633 TaxID=3154355 RepID=UPI00341B9B9D
MVLLQVPGDRVRPGVQGPAGQLLAEADDQLDDLGVDPRPDAIPGEIEARQLAPASFASLTTACDASETPADPRRG